MKCTAERQPVMKSKGIYLCAEREGTKLEIQNILEYQFKILPQKDLLSYRSAFFSSVTL